MTITTITPTIDVTIGGETRLFHAYITTAATNLDAPGTSTLTRGTIRELAGFCLEPDALGNQRSGAPARLVLIDATQLAWQRARYRQHGDQIGAVDPILIGLQTLQQWLWQRLRWSTDSTTSVPVLPSPEGGTEAWSVH